VAWELLELMVVLAVAVRGEVLLCQTQVLELQTKVLLVELVILLITEAVEEAVAQVLLERMFLEQLLEMVVLA
tara:strand:- start:1072 stop:1290 length:219 start_codon:yes stop_codon:yes gene_type:complete